MPPRHRFGGRLPTGTILGCPNGKGGWADQLLCSIFPAAGPPMRRRTKVMTESEKVLMAANSLEQSFPIRFPNGYQVEGLIFWCTACNTPLPLSAVHGQVGSLIEEVVDITAIGSCTCGEISHYRIRLRNDGSFSFLDKGSWVNKEVKENTGLFSFVKRVFYLLKLRIYCFRLNRALKRLQKELKRIQTHNHPPMNAGKSGGA
ncbi:hypothetical protein [Geomesophilobacter sediminis]|uniref:Uncharacterized protein n=1 Tax=Geomesophilobacter sediminis TaxID=2798584 RepID=A0A8J7JJ74_9BACT|nr:hypothetical protein [Geomesophilobacter sediminis]MBJ6724575.1 hypothetical protein [Geomesophilobacter sediminis]